MLRKRMGEERLECDYKRSLLTLKGLIWKKKRAKIRENSLVTLCQKYYYNLIYFQNIFFLF